MKNIKVGWNTLFLIGIIFAVIGAVFTVIGVSFCFAGEFELRLLGMIFGGIGSLFLILGCIFLFYELHKLHRANKLLEEGRFLWAVVVDCVPNYNVRINNRHPYIVVVRYVDGQGTAHIFKSWNVQMYMDPSMLGKQVKVYYRDASYKHYYVDVDSVLKNVVEH